MITVLEAIKLSTDYLEKKQVESSRANAEILLAEILHCKRIDLYLTFDKPLSESELQFYRESIKKRASRMPLQYIVGHTEFYGLNLNLNENVLIPRPETELLVEKIINDQKHKEGLRILDIGSGSGNITLALAKHITNSFVTGIDISEKVIELAIKNSVQNKIENVGFKLFDIMNDDQESLGKFDIIVSNPPYISDIDYESLEPELTNYEPKMALTDNSDGTSFYKRIISISKNLFQNSGYLYFELGKGQYKNISDLMIQEKFTDIQITKDYAGIERIICGEIK